MSSNRWTEEEEQILKAHYAEMGPTKLSNSGLLKRSYEAIRKKAQNMGLTDPDQDAGWTPKEDDILREHYAELGPAVMSRRQMLEGRTYAAIRGRARKLGLCRPINGLNADWSEKEERRLISLFESHPDKGTRQLYQRAQQEGILSDKSYSAMVSKAHDLGLSTSTQERWSQEDEQVIRDYYPEFGAIGIIENGLLSKDMVPRAVRAKAAKMGISKAGRPELSATARQQEAIRKAKQDNWGKLDMLKDALKGFSD